MTIELPYVGFYAEYASTPTYKYRPNEYGQWDKVKELTPTSQVQPMTMTAEHNREFLGALVEMLANIRDRGGDVRCDANLTPAADYLEANGYIVPIAADRWSPYAVNVLYALTEKGKAFLAKHEAPEWWQ